MSIRDFIKELEENVNAKMFIRVIYIFTKLCLSIGVLIIFLFFVSDRVEKLYL